MAWRRYGIRRRLWANVWYSFTLASLTLAVPAAVYRWAEQRAFWVGFAACGWVLLHDGSVRDNHGLDLDTHIVQKDYCELCRVQSPVCTNHLQLNSDSSDNPGTSWACDLSVRATCGSATRFAADRLVGGDRALPAASPASERP